MIYKRYIKRYFDILISASLLILIFPLLVVLSIFIKLDGGPLFYVHNRVGLGGKDIRVYKFRTMIPDAEAKLHSILKSNNLNDEWYSHFRLKNDPRITFIGKYLRSLKIDEVPQLINVILGDMSIVGPRPITLEEIKIHFDSENSIKKYLSILPGITGAWQVYGSKDYKERIEIELKYIENFGLMSDLNIIFKTIELIVIKKMLFNRKYKD